MGSSASSTGTKGIAIENASASEEGWWAALALSGKIYGVPCNADRLLLFDPQAENATTSRSRLAVSGLGKWRSAVALGSKIYGVPDRADQLLIYDVTNGITSFVDTRSLGGGPFKWQSAQMLGGNVYGVPHNAEWLLIYDPATNKVKGVPTTGLAKGPAKWLASATLGGKLYGLPCDAPVILVYDPVSRAVAGVDISHLTAGINSFKWLAAGTVAGKLYGIPCHAECILVYDPVSGDVSGIDTSSIATGPGKWTSAVVHNFVLYGIPDHADSILVYDTRSGVVSGISISHIAEGPAKWQGAVALSGRVFAAPHNAEKLLVYSPATGEASGIDTTAIATGPGKWGMTVALNGRVYGVPYNAAQMLEHIPDGDKAPTVPQDAPPAPAAVKEGESGEGADPAATPADPGSADAAAVAAPADLVEETPDLPAETRLELLEDFVALWLSWWVYQITDVTQPCPVPSVRIGGEEVEFVIQAVHEEPLQGSPARLALVSVTLNRGRKVLYFVFKGTSFLTDFIANSNISPDFAPFYRAFRDSNTFVHHGAFHAISQLRVHERGAMNAVVRSAVAAGVEKIIIAGHSLGGQYAMAFLLQVFLDKTEGDEEMPAIMEGARCVSFGSPMVFGTAEGTDMRKDLTEFFRARATNYIHACDPAPRLWSELDLEGFVRFFTHRLRSQIPASLRSLVDWAVGPGGLAQKAEELMQRSDIESQLLKPAQRYLHISRIRVLGKEFRPWRPLGQDHVVLEDHDVRLGYIAALRAALDQSSSGSLYEEDGRVIETLAA